MTISDVCNLPADELRDRLALVRSEILPQVKRTQRLPDGVAWEFDGAMRPKLEDLVALERQCCSGLEWKLEASQDADTVRLSVEGPGAASLLSEVAAPGGGCGQGC